MPTRPFGLALAVVLVAGASYVSAQQPLNLIIANGRVTLHARNVSIRTILAEWSRLGGTKIIDGDRVTGAPLTLDFENVPERQALGIILRGVSGYMLAARDQSTTGASLFDRIVILPTSQAPVAPPPSAATVVSRPQMPGIPGGIVRPLAPRMPAVSDDDAQNADGGDGVQIPRLLPTPTAAPNPAGAGNAPPATLDVPDVPPTPAAPGVVVTPANPFGLPPGSSTRPGVIAPAPTPAPQPRQEPQN